MSVNLKPNNHLINPIRPSILGQPVKFLLETSLTNVPIIDICHAQQSFFDRFQFAEDSLPLLLSDIIYPGNDQKSVMELENAILTGYSFSCSLNLQNSLGDPESCNIMVSSGSKCVNRFSKSASNGQEVQRHFLTTMTIRSCSAVANIAVLGVAPFSSNSNYSSGAIDERTRQMVSERMDANEAVNATIPKKAQPTRKGTKPKARPVIELASSAVAVAGTGRSGIGDFVAIEESLKINGESGGVIENPVLADASLFRAVQALTPSAGDNGNNLMNCAYSVGGSSTTPTLAALPVLEDCDYANTNSHCNITTSTSAISTNETNTVSDNESSIMDCASYVN